MFKKWGINTRWVTENTAEAYAAAIDEKTKAIFVEIISNPRCILADIPAIAKVGLSRVRVPASLESLIHSVDRWLTTTEFLSSSITLLR